ncbi:MAG: SDR family oxidoreductase [Gordonibacter sp.]|uniref:SDR family NAD(P)-dependent oxidoreductase n=1 Tax=Gordonibacter sp. TaxID=1968902 RepID=UPI002FC81F72
MGLALLEGKNLLEGKKIIVTGGAGGIGSATVDEYVRQGAAVTSIDIEDEKGRAFAAEANAQGPGTCMYVHCDIAVKEEVEAAFAQAKADMGGLDVLVHCAAKMQGMNAALNYTKDDYNFIFDNDMWGTILVDQVACKLMQEYGQGIIVNYSSETALSGAPNDGLYSAAKAGVATWTRVIATEWGHAYNIRCNSVMPTIKTPMYQAYVSHMDPEAYEKFMESRRAKHPIKGDMGDADVDIAPVMVFLACDMSQYITGQIFAINGGNTMVRG